MHQRVDPPGPGGVVGTLAVAGATLTGLLTDTRTWALSDTEVLAGLDAAYRLVTQAQTVALLLLAEADTRRLPEALGATSTAAWLNASRRLRPADAKRDVALARLLDGRVWDGVGDPPVGGQLGRGLAAGEVSVQQAGVIATALDELPIDATPSTRLLAETLLVEYADLHGPAALTRLGHRILERVDPAAADRRLAQTLEREEREATRLRSATRFADGHGSVWYKLRIPVGDDALVWPVLDTLATPQPADDTHPDPRSAAQRLADAFVETFRRVSLDGGLPSAGGDRPRVLVTVAHRDLVSGQGCGTMVDTGDQLSVGAIRRLCCDAQVIPVVLGGESQVLDVGRARRTFDGPIRLAVIARDRGCVHPGCQRPPRWCDVHHVVAWWQGGKTALDNGVLLCGFHHKLYDDQVWRIRFAKDGIPETIPPTWLDPHQRPRRHQRHHDTDRT